MTLRRRPLATVVLAFCVVPLAACSSSHGNASDLLSVTPNPSVGADLAYDNQPLKACDPEPEPSGPAQSDLQFKGPCTFSQTLAVQCVSKTDDYYAYVTRQLGDYGQLSALINVEFYRGPGTYTKNSVVFLQVSRNGVLYEWKNQSATLTVTDGGNEVTVHAAKVPAVAGGPARGVELVDGSVHCRT